jgi:hypothetical protein
MRVVAGSTPGLDFYLLRGSICVSLHLFHVLLKLALDLTIKTR